LASIAWQTMLVSSTEVNRAAAKAYQQTLREAQSKNLLNRDPQQVARVRNRRPPDSGDRNLSQRRPGWRWEINVISSQELNAWCMPGGKIAVYTGLIEQLQLTDDELAAVMAHEIAHALREHGREKGRPGGRPVNAAAAIGGALIGAYFGVDAGSGKASSAPSAIWPSCAPTRAQMEQEADRIGVELAARAAYDPRPRSRCGRKWGASRADSRHNGCRPIPRTRRASPTCAIYAERVQPLYGGAPALSSLSDRSTRDQH
jgi:predicted Zn-dependent protease